LPKLIRLSFSSRVLREIQLQISYRISFRIVQPFQNRVRSLNLQKVQSDVRNSLDSNVSIGKQTILSLLDTKDPLILEIGANIGTDTLEFALMFPLGEIHAFEPLPLHVSKLVENLRGFTNVKIVPAALSDSNGFTKFYQSSGYSGGSGSIFKPTLHLVRDVNTHFKREDECIVPTLTLDDYLLKSGLTKIDFVWIDAQGAELKILQGALKWLDKIRYIYAEVSTVPYYEGACTESELSEFLEAHDFRIKTRFRPDSDECGNLLWEYMGSTKV
jgi:FkbM family methyltransferase